MLKYTLQSIQNIHYLKEESLALIRKELQFIELKKGDILFSPDTKHHYINFIEKGLIRVYILNQDKEITLFFGLEGSVSFPYRTYLTGEISYEIAELLEDCSFYRMPIEKLKYLFLHHLEWANWGRKFAESQMALLDEKFINYQFQSAKIRHESFLTKHPDLFNRIKLKHLASYLGMSQVSLSRIRAGIQ